MRVEDGGKPVVFLVPLSACSCEDTGDLGENTDRVDGVGIGDDIAVGVLVFEQKSTEVGLAVFHHVLDGSDDGWVAHDDGLVESRKERTPGDGQGKDLWVDVGHGLPGDGPGIWRRLWRLVCVSSRLLLCAWRWLWLWRWLWRWLRVVFVLWPLVVALRLLVLVAVLGVDPARRKQRRAVPQKMDSSCREISVWNRAHADETAQNAADDTHRRQLFRLFFAQNDSITWHDTL